MKKLLIIVGAFLIMTSQAAFSGDGQWDYGRGGTDRDVDYQLIKPPEGKENDCTSNR